MPPPKRGRHLKSIFVGASYNGSTAVSKTASVGSIPTAPVARSLTLAVGLLL